MKLARLLFFFIVAVSGQFLLGMSVEISPVGSADSSRQRESQQALFVHLEAMHQAFNTRKMEDVIKLSSSLSLYEKELEWAALQCQRGDEQSLWALRLMYNTLFAFFRGGDKSVELPLVVYEIAANLVTAPFLSPDLRAGALFLLARYASWGFKQYPDWFSEAISAAKKGYGVPADQEEACLMEQARLCFLAYCDQRVSVFFTGEDWHEPRFDEVKTQQQEMLFLPTAGAKQAYPSVLWDQRYAHPLNAFIRCAKQSGQSALAQKFSNIKLCIIMAINAIHAAFSINDERLTAKARPLWELCIEAIKYWVKIEKECMWPAQMLAVIHAIFLDPAASRELKRDSLFLFAIMIAAHNHPQEQIQPLIDILRGEVFGQDSMLASACCLVLLRYANFYDAAVFNAALCQRVQSFILDDQLSYALRRDLLLLMGALVNHGGDLSYSDSFVLYLLRLLVDERTSLQSCRAALSIVARYCSKRPAELVVQQIVHDWSVLLERRRGQKELQKDWLVVTHGLVNHMPAEFWTAHGSGIFNRCLVQLRNDDTDIDSFLDVLFALAGFVGPIQLLEAVEVCTPLVARMGEHEALAIRLRAFCDCCTEISNVSSKARQEEGLLIPIVAGDGDFSAPVLLLTEGFEELGGCSFDELANSIESSGLGNSFFR